MKSKNIVKSLRGKMKKYNIFISVFVVYILLNMVLFPKIYISASFNGIKAWALQVLPSVLPFIFFTKVLSSLGVFDKNPPFLAKPCRTIWNCSSSSFFVFLSSIISGYPVGAAMTADLYQTGKISKSEAFRMCSFCSTSGPMFIVGAVGISMLSNVNYGYIILISHILGAFLNGILYRKIHVIDTAPPSFSQTDKKINLSSVVLDSALSVLSIGTVIAIFFVVITTLSPLFSLFPTSISPLLEGMVEITKGCQSISNCMSGLSAVVCGTFIISFGGISTILQSITLLSKIKMPIKLFVLQKLTHALLSTFIAALIMLFI